MDSTNLYIKT